MMDRALLLNLVGVVALQASASFSNYFITYYTKYFKGNFFINYSMCGIADTFSLLYVKFLDSKMKVQTTLKVLVVGIISTCIIFLIVTANAEYLIPPVIIVIRLHVASVTNYSYHMNSSFFPTLVRGFAYACSNSISRPFNAAATIIVEYTTSPIKLVLFIAIFSYLATFLISQPSD